MREDGCRDNGKGAILDRPRGQRETVWLVMERGWDRVSGEGGKIRDDVGREDRGTAAGNLFQARHPAPWALGQAGTLVDGDEDAMHSREELCLFQQRVARRAGSSRATEIPVCMYIAARNLHGRQTGRRVSVSR